AEGGVERGEPPDVGCVEHHRTQRADHRTLPPESPLIMPGTARPYPRRGGAHREWATRPTITPGQTPDTSLIQALVTVLERLAEITAFGVRYRRLPTCMPGGHGARRDCGHHRAHP